ncbi:ubiquinone biosynthesis protein Coq7 [Chytriomyces cf. hyalinus JEL632]|nr:ubiquinone biosynthesis protein Coq7 [Chytriomyces cf. hyalinus JEL632]
MQSTRRISYAIARSFSTKPSAAATTSKVSHEQLQSIKTMLRVDQAGELAADAIYKGQLATLPRNSPMRATIEHMHEQEKVHLEILNTLVANNRVRPSVFYPVWYAMGYALGAGTGAMGDKAAMMCTEVVEDVIGVHYNDQLRELVKIPDNEEAKNLAQVIKVLRDEELDHLSTAMDNHAKEATLYDPLSMIIRAGCKTAIQVASRF